MRSYEIPIIFLGIAVPLSERDAAEYPRLAAHYRFGGKHPPCALCGHGGSFGYTAKWGQFMQCCGCGKATAVYRWEDHSMEGAAFLALLDWERGVLQDSWLPAETIDLLRLDMHGDLGAGI